MLQPPRNDVPKPHRDGMDPPRMLIGSRRAFKPRGSGMGPAGADGGMSRTAHSGLHDIVNQLRDDAIHRGATALMNDEVTKHTVPDPRILIVGCGGSGNNTLNRITHLGVEGARITVAVNTDKQHLDNTRALQKLLVGRHIRVVWGQEATPPWAVGAPKQVVRWSNASCMGPIWCSSPPASVVARGRGCARSSQRRPRTQVPWSWASSPPPSTSNAEPDEERPRGARIPATHLRCRVGARQQPLAPLCAQPSVGRGLQHHGSTRGRDREGHRRDHHAAFAHQPRLRRCADDHEQRWRDHDALR